MAPGIRPADPEKKGGEGSATGPPATASGAPPAYKDQRSLAGGGAALSRRGVLQPVAPTVWGNRGRHTHAPSLAAPVLLGKTPRGRCWTPRGLRDTCEDKEKVPQWRPQLVARGLQDATPCG